MKTDVVLSVKERERMSLAGLMLASLIQSNLESPGKAASARRLNGSVGVIAGKMKITIRFDGGPVTICRGLEPALKSVVRGSLGGLLSVSLGRGLLRSLLSRDISFSGNPFFLMRILPFIRASSSQSVNR